MAELKTKPNTQSVETFLNGIADEQRRKDCFRVLEIMKAETKAEPAMWGTSIVGFGCYKYKYESGTKGEWFLAGFSPRKRDLTLYIMSGLERYPALLKKLGKHKTGKSCLYIRRLEDVNLPTLKQLIKQSVADLARTKKQQGL
ncbi:MAG: DUF1801 domain-containing protein [Acidobacteriota bacterium]